MGTVQRVWLVRHGETDYNAQRRWQGQLDIPLNANGIDQAQRLAATLAHDLPQIIYSSDLSRTWETARIIADTIGLKPISEPRLREMHVGVFQGLGRDQLTAQYGDIFERWRADDSFAPPEGESRLSLQQRAYAAFTEITTREGAESVMLVTHGGTLRLLFKKLFAEQNADWHFGNTSLSLLQRTADNRWQIVFHNQTTHLDDVNP